MATYKIGGREFPLCLTVASVDQLNELCGGLQGIVAYVGDKDIKTAADHTVKMMRLLMLGGRANAEAAAQIGGGQMPDLPTVPTEAEMQNICIGDILRMRVVALDAITESLHQDISADHEEHDSKNVDAGQ